MRNGCLCLFATLIGAAPVLVQPIKPVVSPYHLLYVDNPYVADTNGGPAAAGSPAAPPGPAGAMIAGCGTTCPDERVWVRGEYLLWFLRGSPTPPLVSTGPAVGTSPGAIGPGTAVLVGGAPVNTDNFNAGRSAVGVWLGHCHRWGLEGEYMFLGPQTTSFTAASADGTAVLARPFTNVDGTSSSLLVAVPPGVSPFLNN